jgi:hypothetical protein
VAVGWGYGNPYYYPVYQNTCIVWNGYGWVNACYGYY